MDETPKSGAAAGPAPSDLRFLRILVATLAGTMILGLLTIVTLIVIRFPTALASRPVLPASIALPEGREAEAVTVGRGWVAVVTDAGTIHVFDAASGALRQTVTIEAE